MQSCSIKILVVETTTKLFLHGHRNNQQVTRSLLFPPIFPYIQYFLQYSLGLGIRPTTIVSVLDDHVNFHVSFIVCILYSSLWSLVAINWVVLTQTQTFNKFQNFNCELRYYSWVICQFFPCHFLLGFIYFILM